MSRRELRHFPSGNHPATEDTAESWPPPGNAEILLVTADPYLRGEVERVVAAAGGSLRTAPDVAAAMREWDNADVVLVGSDIREIPPRRQAPAALIGRSSEGDGLWRLATALGAERVAVLPEAAAWLAEHLSMSGAPEPGGEVLGLIGGSGGVGATTAAIWLAQGAAGEGISTLLIDGDPWGGGIELAITTEDVPGLRWPDFFETRGSLDPTQFRDSLPVSGGFAYLSWPGKREAVTTADASAVAAVLDAARRSFELILVDVGRSGEGLMALAWECDRMLILSTPQLKSAVATARLLSDLPPVDTGLIVRGSGTSAVDAPLIAESLGLPLSGLLPEVRGVAAGTEQGRLLELGRRKQVNRFVQDVLELKGTKQ